MQLFYLPNLKKESKSSEFSKEESKHIFKVLRKKVGDVLPDNLLENKDDNQD